MKSEHMSLRFWQLPVLLAVVLALGLGTALAGSNSSTLPGGAEITVTVANPVTSTDFLIPTGAATRDVDVNGTAAIDFPPSTLLVYVIDVSGSTGQTGGCGGDQNGDGNANFILDCEIAAAKVLNDLAKNSPGIAEVGVAVFANSSAAADVGPAGGTQLLTGPSTDAGGAAGPDVEEVLESTFSVFGGDGGVNQFTAHNVGNSTNFNDGVAAACSIVGASSQANKFVMFMSDGTADGGSNVGTADCAAVFFTFAIGSGSSCTDTGVNNEGSLDDVAALGTGTGTCTKVGTISDLPGALPGVMIPVLESLEIDGSPLACNPGLPQNGPVSCTYATTLTGLGPGNHEFCVTAFGSDFGGSGSVTQCETIHLLQISLDPDGVVNELGTPSQTHTVTATIAGPPAGQPGSVEGRTVDFEIISGPNFNKMGSDTTNAAGEATFTYTAEQGLAGLGTDTIRACVTLNDPEGEEGCDEVTKDWVDTTPPDVDCVETVNPHGKKIPPAGSTTLPGPKGGQNEDGFYELLAVDAVDPNPSLFVFDTGSGTVFGPFANNDKIKYTEDADATPESKKIGSTNGKAGAIAAHIIGNGDPALLAFDAAGNLSDPVFCLVPPPPK